jgi:hypothetical protein
VLAQAQTPPPPPTAADAQKVAQIIKSDPAKMQAYCQLAKLNDQMAAADEKKDSKTVDALGKQADGLESKLGPDYAKLMDGLSQLDDNSPVSKQIADVFDPLDKQCK